MTLRDQHLATGIELLDQGQTEKALAFFEQVLQQSPEEPQACFFQGDALAELGRIEERSPPIGEDSKQLRKMRMH